MLLGIVGTANAATYTDLYDVGAAGNLNPLYMNSDGNNSVSWQHNILPSGYDPTQETLTSATITLGLTDSPLFEGDSQEFEYADLQVGGNNFQWEVNFGLETLVLSSYITLDLTGILSATLTATEGDFYFYYSKLIAESEDRTTAGDPPLTQTPIPSALLLMGSGLIAVAGAARRRKTKA